jgi:hypothetical protein
MRIPSHIAGLQLDGTSIDVWLETASGFAAPAASRGNLIVLFSPLLRSVAADLESKLSESALLYCQLADIRSFAWLARRAAECSVRKCEEGADTVSLFASLDCPLSAEVATFIFAAWVFSKGPPARALSTGSKQGQPRRPGRTCKPLPVTGRCRL